MNLCTWIFKYPWVAQDARTFTFLESFCQIVFVNLLCLTNDRASSFDWTSECRELFVLWSTCNLCLFLVPNHSIITASLYIFSTNYCNYVLLGSVFFISSSFFRNDVVDETTLGCISVFSLHWFRACKKCVSFVQKIGFYFSHSSQFRSVSIRKFGIFLRLAMPYIIVNQYTLLAKAIL